MNTVALDAPELLARLGRAVIAAAERAGGVQLETDAYDAVAHLLMGTQSVGQLLRERPALAPIRADLLEFAQRLQSLLDQPAQHPASSQ